MVKNLGADYGMGFRSQPNLTNPHHTTPQKSTCVG